MPDFQISPWDLTILAVYVIGTRILFGWYASRRARTGAEGYFLGGRAIRWPIIGLSFYVANMSGGSFVGLPGSGYNDGIAVYHYEWLPALILVLFIFFILPLYLRARVYTAPQFLEERFGRRPRLAFSGFLLVAVTLIDAPASLYAGTMVGQTLFPGVPLWLMVAVASLVAGVYIFVGGLGAVVINDALQATMILLGGTLILVLAWQAIPSWDAVVQAAPEDALHLMHPAHDPLLPWPGIITGVLVIGIYFWCTNQFVVQRALGAKNLDHGRWGSLFAGLLKLPNLFILILPGVMATVLYPNLERPDLVFPTMVVDLLPVGLRGLLLAAFVAAILSSLEAIFNSSATLFTMDFVRLMRPQTSDHGLAAWGRGATLGFMLLAVLWTPFILQFPTLWQYLQSFMSYITPPVTAVFLIGIFWRRANEPGAFYALAIGVPLGIGGWVANELLDLFAIQYLYAAGIMFVISAALIIGISLLTPAPPPEKVQQYVWRPALWRQESVQLAGKPWYANYRYMALGLALLAAAMVVWWW